mmetsp:Transcript_137203/g.356507  ORF Transcript_137203/g.356507 Transcript_137203/m.356507 type:complete len:330 (-) Transcript_137203:339-1328(-)
MQHNKFPDWCQSTNPDKPWEVQAHSSCPHAVTMETTDGSIHSMKWCHATSSISPDSMCHFSRSDHPDGDWLLDAVDAREAPSPRTPAKQTSAASALTSNAIALAAASAAVMVAVANVVVPQKTARALLLLGDCTGMAALICHLGGALQQRILSCLCAATTTSAAPSLTLASCGHPNRSLMVVVVVLLLLLLLLCNNQRGTLSLGRFAKHFCNTAFASTDTPSHCRPASVTGCLAAVCKDSKCSMQRSRPCGRRPESRRCMHKPTAQTSLNSPGKAPSTTSGAAYTRVPVGVSAPPSSSRRAALKSMSFKLLRPASDMTLLKRLRATSKF